MSWFLVVITLSSAGLPQMDWYSRQSGELCRRQAGEYTRAGFAAVCVRGRDQAGLKLSMAMYLRPYRWHWLRKLTCVLRGHRNSAYAQLPHCERCALIYGTERQ